MGQFLSWFKSFWCKHEFETIAVYDQDTVKSFCPKCGHKFVVNKAYKWKFRLNDVSEKDYEDLRKEIDRFRQSYREDDG